MIAKELGRGGEGAVFDIVARPDSVAKVYLKAPGSEHAAKLSAMISAGNTSLLKVAAWPTDTLHNSAGAVVGFIMPKVGGHKPIFKLYGPRQRLQEFPEADWRFLIHAAANAARAFSLVHSLGLVIGDVNHGNLVVSHDATVRMIDCDSFQFSSGSKMWFCNVGVGTHQPPEMQCRESYDGIVRTPNYDNFGLAVIIFQLLCIARHPFMGSFAGQGEPPTIEEAILASRYAYSRDQPRTKLSPPPGSLPIISLSLPLQELFEKAFAPGTNRGGRPIAQDWVQALDEFGSNLKNCRANGAHYHKSYSTTCPWCEIEASTGVILFPVIFVPGSAGNNGMAALWQEFSKLGEPIKLGVFPDAPTISVKASIDAQFAAQQGKRLRTAAWSSIAGSIALTSAFAPVDVCPILLSAEGVLAFVIYQYGKSEQTGLFYDRLASTRAEWIALDNAWISSSSPLSDLNQLRTIITKIKAEHDNLPAEKARRMQALFERRRDKQLEEHLDRFSLANANIPGVGATKIATLASHGIATAGDIVETKALKVPGFGPTTVAKLLVWRSTHEMSFRFDPKRAVSGSEKATVERDIAMRRTVLEREVQTSLVRMKTSTASALNRHRTLHGKLSELRPRYSQALADEAIAPKGGSAYKQIITLSLFTCIVAAFSTASFSNTKVSQYRQTTSTVTQMQVPSFSRSAPFVPPSNPPEASVQSSPSSTAAANVLTAVPTLKLQALQPMLPKPALFTDERLTLKVPANVRASADGSSQIVKTVPRGSTVRVFSRSGSWVQVGDEAPWGWVFSGLLFKSP